MKSLVTVALLLLKLKISVAIQLNCAIIKEFDGLSCKMLSSFNGKDQIVTSSSGNFGYGKSSANVNVLWITADSLTSYLPIKTCSHFTSLSKIDVESKRLKEISRDVFRECSKVRNVYIFNSMISYLPEDVFDDLNNLVYLDMHNNKLLSLPMYLFLFNPKLKEVNFNNNMLAIIDTYLPSYLTLISFKDNICTDKKFPGDYQNVAAFKEHLQTSCSLASMKLHKNETESKMTAYQSEITSNSEKISQLKRDLEELSIEKGKLQIKDNQCQQNITLNLIKLVEQSKEIQLLTANHTQSKDQTEQLFNEIISLKLNVSQTDVQLTDKTRDLASCSTERVYLNNTIKLLNANLSATQMKIKSLELDIVREKNDCNVSLATLYFDADKNCSNIVQDLNVKFNETHEALNTATQDESSSVYILSVLLVFTILGWITTVILYIINRKSNAEDYIGLSTLLK